VTGVTGSMDGIVGGSSIARLSLFSGDLGATHCGAPSKPQPTTWNGRSGIWRHNYSVRMACPTAKRTRIKLTWPSPRLVYHCYDAISRIQEGPCPRCTQARSLSARDGEDSGRPVSASEVDLDARPLCGSPTILQRKSTADWLASLARERLP